MNSAKEAGHNNLNTIHREACEPQEDRPFFVHEGNPHFLLWKALAEIIQDAGALKIQTEWIHHQFVILDNAPRHDTVLCDSILSAINQLSRGNRRSAIYRAKHQIEHSLQTFQPILDEVRGVFRGEEKVQTEDRLERHLLEAARLLEIFRSLPEMEGAPNQPYAIRQQRLVDLILTTKDLTNALTPLRRQLKEFELPEPLLVVFVEQETRYYRINALFKKWRDNPSQKLAEKLAPCIADMTLLTANFEALRLTARKECRRQGMRLFNRCGEIIDKD